MLPASAFPLGEAVFNRFAGTSFAAGNYCASSSVRTSLEEDVDVFPPNIEHLFKH